MEVVSTSTTACDCVDRTCERKDDEGDCPTPQLLRARPDPRRGAYYYRESLLTAWRLFHKPSLLKKLVAEGIGTFSVVFAGCGAIVVNRQSDGAISHGGIAATFGLVVAAMIYATGHISGAHFNPAVTFAFALAGRFPWKEVPGYVVSQAAAAALAAAAVHTTIGSDGNVGATLPRGTSLQSFGLEVVLTFFLMFVISAVATDNRAEGTMAGIAIGATVALDALFGGPVSGASMNPVRSFGPALVAGVWDHFWVYLAGPLLGAALGALSYEVIRCDVDNKDKGAYGCCK